MRRRLVLVFLAVSTLVAMAFVVPLGFLVRRTAEDRAIDAARADAAALVPALVSADTEWQIEAALSVTGSGREGRVTVVRSDGLTIGPDIDPSSRLAAALEDGASDIGPVPGGAEVVAAVATGPNELSAIRVFVPDSELRRGQWRAWGALAAVGLVLVAISVLVADRLARTIVRPTQGLASAAKRLGAGELDTLVEPAGPEELVDLAGAFNDLGTQVSSMLQHERELVAELSHRLRTPLTKLRMRTDQVTDSTLAAELRDDVDDVTSVVSDLIQEARGRTPVEDNECDAGSVVTARAEYWSVLADDQQRAWRFERGGRSLPVPIPEAELVAAVDVLIENVFSHTPDGTALTIGYRADKNYARIWVADAGPGVDAVAEGESGVGSTGFGLNIARRSAESVGGELQIGKSDLGGAEVRLILPIVAKGNTGSDGK